MSKIALCVIAEGDIKLASLKKLYDSVLGHVDDIFITANGKETKKLEKWCASCGIHYSYQPWSDNFSDQRNFNFEQAIKHDNYDYLVWADSDDVIIGAKHLRRYADVGLKNRYDEFFFEYWYGAKFDGEPSMETLVEPDIIQKRERMFRPGLFYWKGRLHETPEAYSDDFTYTNVKYSKENPIVWLHLGAERTGDYKARTERNRRILELQLKDERAVGQADPRTLLYLMKIYAEENDEKTLTECIYMGQEYLSKSGWDEERAVCCYLMAKCMGKLGDDQGAADLLHDAIKEYESSPVLYLQLAKAYYNLGKYRQMKHYMDIGINLPQSSQHTDHIYEIKILSAGLLKAYAFSVEKDTKKAYAAAKVLAELAPDNDGFVKDRDMLYDLMRTDKACKNIDEFVRYLDETGKEDLIEELLDTLPEEIKALPFVSQRKHKYGAPRVWGEKEIAYVCNYAGGHFEKWGPKSLDKGVGGSETAVIELSKQWAKKGYKVTVYGDPGLEEGEHDGVLWLPWFKFNHKDKFNIVIQWRSNSLAGKISAKKYYVDLHDVFNQNVHKPHIDFVDKLFVKSDYHRQMASDIPDDKMKVVSNGI